MEMQSLDKMRRWRGTGLCCLVCLTLATLGATQTDTSAESKNPAHTSASSATKAKSSTTTKHTSSRTNAQKTKSKSSRAKKGSRTSKKRGQQVIDGERARAIQQALIREHYMQGEPSGKWDSATQEAMQRYQADQGWQAKTTPDSRALIKLGLGPSHDHLLNPESAMTAADPKPASKPNPADTTSPSPSDRPQQ